ncbi:MAG: alpha/beta hydrolase [Roseitalea porphyridii]|uniref:alpha/beta hydrolase n=2 Tax=Alphaproteobacteria TaxID=28211 RepID=UPI0032ED13C9
MTIGESVSGHVAAGFSFLSARPRNPARRQWKENDMIRLALLSGVVAVTLTLQAAPMPAFAEEPHFFRDIRPNHWVWNGADPLTTQSILARVAEAGAGAEHPDLTGAGGATVWTDEFARVGDQIRALAEEQEALGLTGAAAALYMRASANYTLAKYPLIDPSPAEAAAFEASLETLHRAHELRGFDVEPVSVTFQNGEADGHVLLPRRDAPAGGWPLVIASNGIDVNQGEFFAFAEDVASRGIAFLMYDIAGTGTNAEFPLGPDYEELPVALAATLAATDRFDADRIAIMGVSFGGNAAVKLAHTRPDLFAASVNVCGPLHSAFQVPEDQLDSVGLMYRLALYDRTGIDGGTDPARFLAHMRGFSLIDQGVIVPGETVTEVPILSVNARNDYVAPAFDMELANNSTVDGTLIYSGTDDQCPQDRFAVMPQVADWLEQRLSLNKN